MPPAITNINVGSNSVGDSVRNEATFEGFVMPPITRPDPKVNPLKNSIVQGRSQSSLLLLAAKVQMAKVSRLAMAMRYSERERMLESKGAGDRLTDFTPRSDAVCMRVEDAKPAIMNMPMRETVGGRTTRKNWGKN